MEKVKITIERKDNEVEQLKKEVKKLKREKRILKQALFICNSKTY